MAAPLNVLHLIDTGGPGGAETVLVNVVGGLDPARWRSIVVAPEVNWLYRTLRDQGRTQHMISNLDGPSYLLGVHRLMRRYRVSLVHAHLLGAGVYGTIAGAPLGVPVVCTFHGRADISARERFLSAKLRILDRRQNRFVFVTEDLKDHVLARYPLDPRRARVVHNGIDLEPVIATGSEREELGVPAGVPLVGAIGNLRPAKDYHTLLHAAALLRSRGSEARWVVLGHGEGRLLEELVALRESLGLADVVAFPGFHGDARRMLSAFDIFVVSSATEGFSLATVEALWAGKPAVVTRCGGPEEILRDGETGLFVPTASPAALAEGVERLLRDPTLAARLGAAGRRDVRERFSRERMVEGYEGVYREVLEGLRSRSQSRASLAAG